MKLDNIVKILTHLAYKQMKKTGNKTGRVYAKYLGGYYMGEFHFGTIEVDEYASKKAWKNGMGGWNIGNYPMV